MTIGVAGRPPGRPPPGHGRPTKPESGFDLVGRPLGRPSLKAGACARLYARQSTVWDLSWFSSTLNLLRQKLSTADLHPSTRAVDSLSTSDSRELDFYSLSTTDNACWQACSVYRQLSCTCRQACAYLLIRFWIGFSFSVRFVLFFFCLIRFPN